MTAPLSYEEVKKYFSEFGCTLLSEKYENARTPLIYQCKNGHIVKLKFDAFKNSKNKCRKCIGKVDFADVKQFVEENGCVLLSEEYKNDRTKLDFICKCGKPFSTTFQIFKRGGRCWECGNMKIAEMKKLTLEEVRKYFLDAGCILLSTSYKNNKQPLNYICICGNHAVINYNHFRQGERCVKCSGTEKLTYEQVVSLFQSRGYTLLSTEYKNAKSGLLFECDKGHRNEISAYNLKIGRGCKTCFIEHNRGPNHYAWKHFKPDEDRQTERRIPGYKEWRASVLARDNYTCYKCKKRGGKLVAHHLQGYAENKSLRTEVTNGVTLCRRCHYKFHAMYGFGGNTKEQFEEYIGEEMCNCGNKN